MGDPKFAVKLPPCSTAGGAPSLIILEILAKQLGDASAKDREDAWRSCLEDFIEEDAKRGMAPEIVSRCAKMASEVKLVVDTFLAACAEAHIQVEQLKRQLAPMLLPGIVVVDKAKRPCSDLPQDALKGVALSVDVTELDGEHEGGDDRLSDMHGNVGTSKLAYMEDKARRRTLAPDMQQLPGFSVRSSVLASGIPVSKEAPGPARDRTTSRSPSPAEASGAAAPAPPPVAPPAAAPAEMTLRRFSDPQMVSTGISDSLMDMSAFRRRTLRGNNPTANLKIYQHLNGHPEQCYELGVVMGSGTFGTVRQGKHKRTSATHAIKTVNKSEIPEDELWKEIDIMKDMDHPHIMRLYYTFEDDLHVHLSMDLCFGGELFDAIANSDGFSEQVAALLFKQCLSAVAYIHQNGVCHRDIKPENFLLSQKERDLKKAKVKLIDFGTAKRFQLHALTTKVCTVHYVAPEVLSRKVLQYTEKVDVWSCGVVLFVMLSGSCPFDGEDDRTVLKKVKSGKYSFEPANIWTVISQGAQDFIRQMLCVSVPERLGAITAHRSHWFEEQQKSLERNETTSLDVGLMQQMRSFVGHSRLKKVALQLIARTVTNDHLERLKEMFLQIDNDMSGSLSMDEMEEALRRLKVPMSVHAEMKRLLLEMSATGDGQINYTQFLAMTMKEQEYLNDSVLSATFKALDVDGDGQISVHDMKTSLGLTEADMADMADMINECDKDGDGLLSLTEFKLMMGNKQISMTQVEGVLQQKKGGVEPTSPTSPKDPAEV
eukprot:TRINITY_DN113708_c0_g1_i1.p1 TRINITY_DN113708_c0_g1~~TRINITY_DN113708_c0_g1_i1.p1  ORF type:complete len:770 (+),score=223.38 TRINITY_DN113708_c0_g1_i1:99-2408(+)